MKIKTTKRRKWHRKSDNWQWRGAFWPWASAGRPRWSAKAGQWIAKGQDSPLRLRPFAGEAQCKGSLRRILPIPGKRAGRK